MIEELEAASSLLRVALDRYFRVCADIQQSCSKETPSTNDISRELAKRVKDETHTILDYESKFQQAKFAITDARNSVALAPACLLPPEILAQIFRLVMAGDQCSNEANSGVVQFSKYPERLSHVCSRWREISIGLRDIWTHIDLSPDSFLNQQLILRAKSHAERSGTLPLFIHIKYSTDPILRCVSDTQLGSPSNITAHAIKFIASLAPRTKVLHLDMDYDYVEFHRLVVETCLKGCVPGIFSELVMHNAYELGIDDEYRFIKTQDDTLTANYIGERTYFIPLELSQQHFEDVLFRCNTLTFDGIFVPWTSRAYHGLTELHLIRTQHYRDNSIRESELVAILRASPQLRVLEFDIWPSDPLPLTSPVEPILLHDLESLAVGIYDESMMGEFFRWIAPGPKPLDILIDWPEDSREGYLTPHTISQLTAFFSRSNARRLSATGFQSCRQVSDLLQLAPRVFEFALESTEWDEAYERKLPTPGVWLKTLYILESSMHLRDLLQLAEAYSVRELICWRYVPITSGKHLDLKGHAVYHELAQICPVVRIMDDSEPRPVPGWT